jgi:hypothetical protein
MLAIVHASVAKYSIVRVSLKFIICERVLVVLTCNMLEIRNSGFSAAWCTYHKGCMGN